MRINELEQPSGIKTAYHITTVPNAEEILHWGLEPTNGKIFLVPDLGDDNKLKNDLGTVARWMYAKTEHTDDPLTLLQVNVSGIPLEQYNGWYISSKPIGPERVKDLGERALGRYY